MNESALLSCEEVAVRLGVSTAWVRAQCFAKVIVATKLGRSYRIDERDYEAFKRKYRGVDAPPVRTQTRRKHRRVA